MVEKHVDVDMSSRPQQNLTTFSQEVRCQSIIGQNKMKKEEEEEDYTRTH